jgi:hypothetical protein
MDDLIRFSINKSSLSSLNYYGACGMPVSVSACMSKVSMSKYIDI